MGGIIPRISADPLRHRYLHNDILCVSVSEEDPAIG